MVPSGYKEDTVYSVVPSDGSGDLSFTRASNGTRVNSAGLVEVTPWNLVQNSEQYNAGTWLLAFLSISTNSAVAPNGTTTADLLYPSSSEAYCYVSTTSFSVVGGQIYTQSVYLKSSGFRWGIVDNMAGSPGAWFDLLNGVVGNVASGCTASIESVGNGWYRCSVSSVAQSSTNYADFRMSDSNGSDAVTANGTDGLYVWGFQINVGSNAKPYFPTTDRLNVPRLTYQNGGGGCPSLLLEKQSTNIATYSEDATQWNKGSNVGSITVTANQTISPDGTQNADKVQFPAVGSGSQYAVLFFPFTASATTYTGSVWLKGENGGEVVWINFTKDGVNYTQTLCTLTTSWQRFTLSSTLTSGADNFQIGVDTRDSAESAKPAQTIYVWGRQLEASSYVTTLIPTTSASATRVADACFKTGISSLIGQSEGVMFAEINVPSIATAGNYSSWQLNDGSTSNLIDFTYYSTGRIQAIAFIGGSLQVNIDLTSFGLTAGNHKIAFAYKLNDYVLYVDGVQVGSDTSAQVPAMSKCDLFTGSNQITIYNQFAVFPTRLTNAELASLTTI